MMRGAFNPWLHLAWGGLSLALAFWLSLWVDRVASADPTASWARLDARVAPIAFAAGLLAGHLIGRRRLGLLRRVWPELEGRFFFTESAALDKYGSDASFIQLQRSVYAGTAVAAFFLASHSPDRLLFWSSAANFIVGVLVAGKTLPVLRLWFERRRGRLGSVASQSREEPRAPAPGGAVRWLGVNVAMRAGLALLIAAIAVRIAAHPSRGASAAAWAHTVRVEAALVLIGLAAGAAVGHWIGSKRLQILRKRWPDIPRWLFLVERGILRSSPEGKRLVRWENISFAAAGAAFVIAVTVMPGRRSPPVVFAWYIVGHYSAGFVLPLVRLWLELRKAERDPQAGS